MSTGGGVPKSKVRENPNFAILRRPLMSSPEEIWRHLIRTWGKPVGERGELYIQAFFFSLFFSRRGARAGFEGITAVRSGSAGV